MKALISSSPSTAGSKCKDGSRITLLILPKELSSRSTAPGLRFHGSLISGNLKKAMLILHSILAKTGDYRLFIGILNAILGFNDDLITDQQATTDVRGENMDAMHEAKQVECKNSIN